MSDPHDPTLRAGTRDRDACAQVLNEAMAEGRLTADEHDERLSRCYAAVTMGDLAALTADVPQRQTTDVASTAAKAVPAGAATRPPTKSGTSGLRGMWASWAGVSILVTVIWALGAFSSTDGESDYFWPMWVIGPWGAVNAMVSVFSWGGRGK